MSCWIPSHASNSQLHRDDYPVCKWESWKRLPTLCCRYSTHLHSRCMWNPSSRIPSASCTWAYWQATALVRDFLWLCRDEEPRVGVWRENVIGRPQGISETHCRRREPSLLEWNRWAVPYVCQKRGNVGSKGLGTRSGAAAGQNGPTRQQILVLALSSLLICMLGHWEER